jgi:hypothetical protein
MAQGLIRPTKPLIFYFSAAHTDAGIAATKLALTMAFDATAASSQDGYLSVAKEHAS